MKKFKALETTALILEVLAYINLITIVVVIIMAILGAAEVIDYYSGTNTQLLFGTIVVSLYGLVTYLIPMAIANLLRLQVVKYETMYANLEVSKDILHQLKTSNISAENTAKNLAFNAWKENNPNKGINDFFTETNQ